MADNVTFQSSTPATPPADLVVSTEEVTTLNGGAVSAQQIQRVAAAIRTGDGTAVDLPGDSSNGLDVDVTRIASALPAGTNAIGTVDLVATGTIQRAAISASTSGDNTIVAALAGNKTKVLGLVLIASGDVDVRLENGAGGTALTGVMSLAVDGNGFVLPMAHKGYHWLETSQNTLLNLELSAAVQVSGFIVYYQEA